MSSASRITRRGFVITGALGGAGFVLAYYAAFREKQPRHDEPGTFSPNVWLQIAPDNTVTIWVAKSEMGQGVRTSMAMLVAEELDADWSTIRIQQAPTSEDYGEERTQGSTSVRMSWQILRQAGATARAMLLTAAAQQWRVEPSTCNTENGAVLHSPTGRRISYGELAIAASTLTVPKNVSLKSPAEFRLLGKPLRRVDTPGKVNGNALFGMDVKLPGMVYASVVRCPSLGGKLKSFDSKKAESIRGVLHVLKITNGVAVVADSTWAAFQGRLALEVQWEEGPNRDFSDDTIRESVLQFAKQKGVVAQTKGDVDSALASAAKTVEASYELPFLAHAALEPLNCTARVQWNHCEIWCPTQDPAGVRKKASRTALLPPAWVDVHTTLLGGGFGRRLETDMVVDAVELSKSTGKIVQVVWTREDDTRHDFYRPAAYSRCLGALDSTGHPAAWKHHIVSQSISSRFELLHTGIDSLSVQGATDLPYAIPNLRVEYVESHQPVPVGYWRSVGYALNAFFTECFVDELASAAGKDPFTFRLELLQNSSRKRAVLELAAEKSDWGEPLSPGRGRGIAMHTSYRTTVAQVVEVSTAADGKITVDRVVCAVDCGQIVNPDTIEAQIQGGIVFGLSAALWGKITFEQGRVKEGNFDDYRVLRISQMPNVEVFIVPSTEPPTGVGEVAVPPVAPALANAFFAATGKRIRRLPIQPL
jgi:isoquinoline 1-oxidoreductase beta subunit